MALETLWFVILAILWVGFFVLEGFDFGVGMLHAFVGRDEHERNEIVGTIEPVWDGNEVWLVVAGAGTFAAFPVWYATMFSGFYLALVLLLLGLIVRGTAIVFRERHHGRCWRATWAALLTFGSFLTPLLIGVALASLLHGVPIDADQEFAGGIADLLSGYSLLFGATTVLLCLLHGSSFVALKTRGPLRERSAAVERRIAPVALAGVAGLLAWTQVSIADHIPASPSLIVAGLAVAAAWWLAGGPRRRASFAASTVAIAATVATIFFELYPRVMVSSTSTANDLTIENASSSTHALEVMTIVTLVLFPIVVLYQFWTYRVFRERTRTGE
jgi:cytochrome d ubiquinol oxidase subunit II